MMKKRVLSLLLVLLMVVTLVPMSALAANDVVTYKVTGGYLYFDRSTGAIVGCDNTVTEAVIPNEIYGIKVRRLEQYAFSGCTKLTKVTIASSVESINSLTFADCDYLTSINVDADNLTFSSVNGVLFNKNKTVLLAYPCGKTDTSYKIPDGVKEIFASAFLDCANLENIYIPSGLESIGRYALSGCKKLQSVTLPNTVTSIGEGAFSLCYSLKSFTVENDNPAYSAADGVLFNKDKTTLICYPSAKADASYVVPNSVTSLERWAFSVCMNLTNITLPYGLKSIGYDAFLGCENLKNIILPNTVSSIGDEAFFGCKSLESIILPNKIKEIEEETFYGCSSLKSVNIPESVRTIGQSAFGLCNSLTDVYYAGSAAQWNTLNLSTYNEALTKANVHTGAHIHDYSYYIITYPTCTQPESFTYKCMSCNYQYSYINADALGHNYKDGVCMRCGEKDPNHQASHTHSYAAAVTDPSCTAAGYTTYTCSCGESYKDNYTDALGHSYDNGKCIRCGAADPNYKPASSFVDVASTSYCYDAVQWAVDKGITNGTDATHFSPNAGCTRAQVVTFLWRAAGSPDVSTDVSFVDVSASSVYYKAIKWAVANGITKGTDATHFSPDATCTRGQVVTFMHRAAGEPTFSGADYFVDVAYGSYCYNAVRWAVAKGITKGFSDTTFAPNATCTRGQVVTFLYRAQ